MFGKVHHGPHRGADSASLKAGEGPRLHAATSSSSAIVNSIPRRGDYCRPPRLTARSNIPAQIDATLLATLKPFGKIKSNTAHSRPFRSRCRWPVTLRPAGIRGERRSSPVASSKGGVGNSTVAVNLACAITNSSRGLVDGRRYPTGRACRRCGRLRPPTITPRKLDPFQHFV